MKFINQFINHQKIKPMDYKTATIVTFNNSTKVSLHLANGAIRKVFNGVYEALDYCLKNDINLKFHINNQPSAR